MLSCRGVEVQRRWWRGVDAEVVQSVWCSLLECRVGVKRKVENVVPQVVLKLTSEHNCSTVPY